MKNKRQPKLAHDSPKLPKEQRVVFYEGIEDAIPEHVHQCSALREQGTPTTGAKSRNQGQRTAVPILLLFATIEPKTQRCGKVVH